MIIIENMEKGKLVALDSLFVKYLFGLPSFNYYL